MHLEPTIIAKLEIQASRVQLVGLHLPSIHLGHNPHEHLGFFLKLLLHFTIGGNEVDQAHLVILFQVLERGRDNPIARRFGRDLLLVALDLSLMGLEFGP